MKGSLFSRDEAAKMAAGGPGMSGEGDDDDDDDDEDDANPASGTMGQVSMPSTDRLFPHNYNLTQICCSFTERLNEMEEGEGCKMCSYVGYICQP